MFVSVAIFLVVSVSVISSTLPPTCESQIYCQGDLLHTVQVARIFNDSKTFVDLKMINNETNTLQNFANFMQAHQNVPNKTEITQFVNDNFEAGNELQTWTPTDFNPNPKFLLEVNDVTVRDFARQLVQLWRSLGKKVKPEVFAHREQHSLIPVPNGFIIPGGRFQEYYYWDSYWIVNGLLISEMGDTARGMIDNFISVVKNYGFMPNGGRVYYTQRSQPPLLTAMADSYFEYSSNTTWLRENIQYLEQELKFWLDKRTTQVSKDGVSYTLAHYAAPSQGPRPESYLEDLHTASAFPNYAQQQELYTNLKSGAESGWDFSSRWIFDDTNGKYTNLSYIETTRVIPVDLNAYLCGAFKGIASLYSALGDDSNSELWVEKGKLWQNTIEQVLWNEEDGIWYDFDSKLSTPRKCFFPSNVAPLWARCFDQEQGENLGTKVLTYLRKTRALEYFGGIPTSLEQTGEQWDFPNAWPPLQEILVQSLERTRNVEAQKMAKLLAKRWITANIRGFSESGEMFEKYDAVNPGKYGGGGEYTVQSGFGWTNGVAIKFIHQYYRNLNQTDASTGN